MSDVNDRFVCANCNASFTRKSSLKVHILNRCPGLNSDFVEPKLPKKFTCNNCNASFTQKHGLKSHLFKSCSFSKVKKNMCDK